MTPARRPSRSRGRSMPGLGDHRGERALHDRVDADDVAALLARQPEVVDVEDRHVGAAGLQLLERVGRGAGAPDLERARPPPRRSRARSPGRCRSAPRWARSPAAAWRPRSGRSPPAAPPQPPMRSPARARVRAMRTPVWWRWMARRVTFSRNLTLSLSRTCRCYCKYCAFATHRAHLHEPDEVERILDGARRHRAKELLVLTGEAPDHHPGVRERLLRAGLRGLHGLRRVGLRAGAGARPAPAHQPRRAQPRGPRPPARGDRLPGPDARVGQPGPGRPPGLADQAPGASGWRRSAPPAS